MVSISLDGSPGVNKIDERDGLGSEVLEIKPVDELPIGIRAIRAEWKDGIAICRYAGGEAAETPAATTEGPMQQKSPLADLFFP